MLYSNCALEVRSFIDRKGKLFERVGRKAVSLTPAKGGAWLSGSRKLVEMRRILLLLALTTFVFLQSVPAYCTTMSFQVSVTMPEHVMASNTLGQAISLNSTYQLVQTQTVIRDNERINLTSIVVA